MRTIKFRAWDTKSKEMLDCHDVASSAFLLNDNLELMQFTGLLDKNGVEIYEGDILEKIIVNEHGTFKEKTVVEWEENTSGSGEYDDDYSCGFCFKSASDIDKFEIIGNIYENPELLKN